jgi:hypothetical protein
MDVAIEEMLKNIQSSRPVGPKVLYGGDLQDNTDQYFRPSPFHNQDNVPAAPRNLFCEYGATAVVDNRPFMTPQPQVPRDPELEALNQYFNKQRVLEFARGASRSVISEVLAKQAEQVANAYVKDEIDRRSGIRKSVLLNSGVTEADANKQIAGEALGGINLRTMDMRDRQVQDAVNMYYNINNLPTPATQIATSAVPSTIPSGVEVPQEDADQIQDMNDDMEDTTEFPAEEPMVPETMRMPTGATQESGGVASQEIGARFNDDMENDEAVSNNIPSRPSQGGAGGPEIRGPAGRPFDVDGASRAELVGFILRNSIRTAHTTSMRTGAMLAASSLMAIPVDDLRDIIREHATGRRFPEF